MRDVIVDPHPKIAGAVGAQGPLVSVVPEFVEAAAARGKSRQYRSYLLLRALDGAGRGWLWWDEAVAGLRRRLSRRQVYNVLHDACDGVFARKVRCAREGRHKVKLASHSALLDAFGLGRARIVRVPVADLLGPGFKRALYLAGVSVRNGRPTSRAVRARLTGASPSSQRRYEHAAGVAVERNRLVSPDACRDAPNAFVRASDGAVLEELPCTTYVPESRARVARRRASAPAEPTGAYKSRCQRRYHESRDGAERSARSAGRSGRWRQARPDIAGGDRLLVAAGPGDGRTIEDGQRVRYWAER